MNYANPRTYKTIFKLATGIILLDFFLNIIWLPIAVSKTYGFQSNSFVWTSTANETGAPPGKYIELDKTLVKMLTRFQFQTETVLASS